MRARFGAIVAAAAAALRTETGRLAGLVVASLIVTLLLVSDGGMAGLVLLRSHIVGGASYTSSGYDYAGTGNTVYSYGVPLGPAHTSTPTATATPTATPTATATSEGTATNTPAPTDTPGPTSTTAPSSTTGPSSTPAPTDTPAPAATAAAASTLAPTQVAVLQPGAAVGLTLPGGGQIFVSVDASVIADLPAGRRMTVVFDPNPIAAQANEVISGLSLGGGNVTRVAPPIDIQFQAIDTTTGTSAPLPGSVLEKRIELKLPVLSAPVDEPLAQFQWLREFRVDGVFAGYFRMDPGYDPISATQVYNLALGEVQGTLFLPAIVRPAYAQNFDPFVRIYSGPTITALDFGVAAPQFTTFTVVGPQVATRIYVYNPATGNYGWIDVAGIGPSGPPPPESVGGWLVAVLAS